MADIVSRPASDAYRANWDRIWGSGYHPTTRCQVCKRVSEGNLDKCPVCRSVWVEKHFDGGVYVPDSNA